MAEKVPFSAEFSFVVYRGGVLLPGRAWSIFASDMYFRFSLRHNPAKGKSDAYLIESYRNEKDRVCHRTLLNVGFLDDRVTTGQLNRIRRILCNRREETPGKRQLFEIEKDDEAIVNDLADELWCRLTT
ncbi:MAG: hypothetical protein LBC19_03220 [Tannerella sp.]|nr:hypothetical protein [Tannerella sp.]